MTHAQIGWLVTAILFASVVLIGIMNASDIDTCESLGNSRETCYATINP